MALQINLANGELSATDTELNKTYPIQAYSGAGYKIKASFHTLGGITVGYTGFIENDPITWDSLGQHSVQANALVIAVESPVVTPSA